MVSMLGMEKSRFIGPYGSYSINGCVHMHGMWHTNSLMIRPIRPRRVNHDQSGEEEYVLTDKSHIAIENCKQFF